MAERLEGFLEKYRNQEMRSTVGVVVPGIVDIERGELEFSANFRWRNVAVTRYLHSRLPGYEFVLENDTKAIALAEHHFGACAGSRSMVVLSIGDGIGAAVILNGEDLPWKRKYGRRDRPHHPQSRGQESVSAAKWAVFRPTCPSGRF